MSCVLIMLRWMVLYCPVKFAGLQQPEKQLDGDLSDRSKNLGFFIGSHCCYSSHRAPSDGFLLNTLKTLFRLSSEPLDL